jgi:hypothetical protein
MLPIDIKQLKEIIKDLPDDFELYIPIWGNKAIEVDDIYVDQEKRRVNIIGDVA